MAKGMTWQIKLQLESQRARAAIKQIQADLRKTQRAAAFPMGIPTGSGRQLYEQARHMSRSKALAKTAAVDPHAASLLTGARAIESIMRQQRHKISGADYVTRKGKPLFGYTPTGKYSSRTFRGAMYAGMTTAEVARMKGGMPRAEYDAMKAERRARFIGYLRMGLRGGKALGLDALRTGFDAFKLFGNAGKAAFTGIVRAGKAFLGLPGKILGGLTKIRHVFWNLAFLAGMVAGSVYTIVKMLKPAGQAQAWQRQFAVMLGPESAKNPLERMRKGMPMAKERIRWLAEYAAVSPFTVSETTEAGKQMTRYGMWDKKRFRLAGDVAAISGYGISNVIQSLGYLKMGAPGRAMRTLRKLGVSHERLAAEGVKFSKGRGGGLVGSTMLSSPDEIMSAVFRIFEKNYGGMLKGMEGTWQQVISNIDDAWWIFRNRAFVGLLPFATKIGNEVRDTLITFGTHIERTFDWTNIGSRATDIVERVLGFARMPNKREFMAGVVGKFIGLDTESQSGQRTLTEMRGSWIKTFMEGFKVVGTDVANIMALALTMAASRIPDVLVAAWHDLESALKGVFDFVIASFTHAIESLRKSNSYYLDNLKWIIGHAPGMGHLKESVEDKYIAAYLQKNPGALRDALREVPTTGIATAGDLSGRSAMLSLKERRKRAREKVAQDAMNATYPGGASYMYDLLYGTSDAPTFTSGLRPKLGAGELQQLFQSIATDIAAQIPSVITGNYGAFVDAWQQANPASVAERRANLFRGVARMLYPQGASMPRSQLMGAIASFISAHPEVVAQYGLGPSGRTLLSTATGDAFMPSTGASASEVAVKAQQRAAASVERSATRKVAGDYLQEIAENTRVSSLIPGNLEGLGTSLREGLRELRERIEKTNDLLKEAFDLDLAAEGI